MKKNGFTLIELSLAIIIVGVMSTFVATQIGSKVFAKQKASYIILVAQTFDGQWRRFANEYGDPNMDAGPGKNTSMAATFSTSNLGASAISILMQPNLLKGRYREAYDKSQLKIPSTLVRTDAAPASAASGGSYVIYDNISVGVISPSVTLHPGRVLWTFSNVDDNVLTEIVKSRCPANELPLLGIANITSNCIQYTTAASGLRAMAFVTDNE